jgi:hypothetical protein
MVATRGKKEIIDKIQITGNADAGVLYLPNYNSSYESSLTTSPFTFSWTNTYAFTISMWVRINRKSQTECLFYGHLMTNGVPGNYRTNSWYDARAAYNRWRWTTDKHSTNTYFAEGTVSFTDNVWYWVCMTFDGTGNANGMKGYVNNTLDSQGTYGGGTATNTSSNYLRIVNSYYTTPSAGEMWIQDWRLYNFVIDSTTRAAIYNSGYGNAATCINNTTPLRHYTFSGLNSAGIQTVPLTNAQNSPVLDVVPYKLGGYYAGLAGAATTNVPTAATGKIYFDNTSALCKYHNGTNWVSF